MIEFKVGILGAGHIAGIIADTLNELDGFTPYAVAARDKERAEQFGKEHNVGVTYGSYEELIQDKEVELIYIATVHSTHAELAKKCIDAGKPSLVEKPFSYNAATAAEVLKYADEKKVFCGEAMWLRYHPLMVLLQDIIKNKTIGDVRTVIADLGYDIRKQERITSPETAGGALLDVGVYPLTTVFMIMNALPTTIASSYLKLSTGVDGFSTLQLNFTEGRFATVTSSVVSNLDNRGIIYGTMGRIEIDNVNCPREIVVYNAAGERINELRVKDKFINGYEFEFLAAREAIIVGRLETPQNTKNNIMQLYTFTDTVRAIWDLIYPLPGEEAVEARKPQKRNA